MDQVGSAAVAARGEYERPWKKIAADMTAKIQAGEWGPGTRLPTIADLQQQYAHLGHSGGPVAKNTVVGALDQLRQEGLIVTRGRSLYVRDET